MGKVLSVNQFFDELTSWQKELNTLRSILLSTQLNEELKWGIPTYTVNGKNVISFSGFKNHFALWFFQGALLLDKEAVLHNAQEGKTKAQRQWRFFSSSEINEELIRVYIEEAILNQLNGVEVKVNRNQVFELSPYLLNVLSKNSQLKKSFECSTPGRRKEYSNYILEAKQDSTKERRIAKITPLINQGVGLNDKYKNC